MHSARLLLTSLILTAAAGVGPAAAQSASPTGSIRGTKAVAERPARVFVMASFGKSCEPVAAPVLTIDQPPGKGTVSFRDGQQTTVQYSLSGQCVGSRVTGTGIYYTAARGQTGTDTFTVTARLASGEVATRTFKVEIAED